jgi:hypothetical protein
MIRSVALVSLLLVSSAFASDPTPIRLMGQVWSRPVGASNRLKLAALGNPTRIELDLEPSDTLSIQKFEVRGEVDGTNVGFIAHGTAILVGAKNGRPEFVTIQTQIVRTVAGETKELVAECSSYHTARSETSPGVGACSGTLDGVQYGVSYRAL